MVASLASPATAPCVASYSYSTAGALCAVAVGLGLCRRLAHGSCMHGGFACQVHILFSSS
eukprot:SAG22_NODE_163_length_16829_cov_9.946204_10_plen_60_part_00